MSQVLHVGVWPGDIDVGRVFAGVVARLEDSLTVLSVRLTSGRPGRGGGRAVEEIPFSETDLGSLAAVAGAVPGSATELRIDFAYATESGGRWSNCSLLVCGEGFDGGHVFEYQGPLSITVAFRDVLAPVVVGTVSASARHGAVDDVRAFMMDVAGVGSDSPRLSEDRPSMVVASRVQEWPAPCDALAVYHASPAGFVDDLERVSRYWSHGVGGARLAALAPLEVAGGGTGEDITVPNDSDERREFMAGLDPVLVDRVRLLEPAEIVQRLTAESDGLVEVWDLSPDGILLMATAIEDCASVLPAYVSLSSDGPAPQAGAE